MNSNEIATKIYNMTEDNIYSIINQFDENQIVDKSLVYCFIKAFYIHTVKIYINIRKVSMDFEKLYLEYKESLITYYKTNNPNIENEVLDQILNFFDNSYGLIESIEFKCLDDSYEFRHYTINVFELLRMILEKKSNVLIRENIFDDYIKIMIQETEKILTYIGSIK